MINTIKAGIILLVNNLFMLIVLPCLKNLNLAIKLANLKLVIELELLHSWQILVPRTSQRHPPPTSPGHPLKILWRPGDALTWRSRHVPGRMFLEVSRTFQERLPEDFQSTQTWMSQKFFQFFFQNLFDWPNLSKSISTFKVYYWEPSQTSKMEHFLQN